MVLHIDQSGVQEFCESYIPFRFQADSPFARFDDSYLLVARTMIHHHTETISAGFLLITKIKEMKNSHSLPQDSNDNFLDYG